MLDLNALQNAFSNLSELGKGEEQFEINGTEITIRLLIPSEELDVQKVASLAFKEESENENIATTKYLESFKLNVLAYAIVQVGDLDLRGVEFVPTGDHLPNGKPVKVTKYKAMRDMLGSFSRKALDNMFQRYSDLSTRIDIETEKSLDYEPIDLSEEIQRLEERLKELKRKQGVSQELASEKSLATEETEQVEETQSFSEDPTPNTVQEPVVETVAPVQEIVTPQPRQRIMPTTAQPVAEKPQPVQAPVEMEREQVLETIQSSFVDKEKDQPFPESAILQEHERLNKLRQSQQVQTQHRRPPHLRARETAEQVGGQVGELDGIPVYRANETQEIGKVHTQHNQELAIDSQPQSSRNPRFRG